MNTQLGFFRSQRIVLSLALFWLSITGTSARVQAGGLPVTQLEPGALPNLPLAAAATAHPFAVSNRATAIAVGGYHACALTQAGGVMCWGPNNRGQLGDGTNTGKNTPVDVSGLSSGVSAIAAGFRHTCALAQAGGVKCWGRNDYGQLGDGTNDDRNTPIDVSGLPSGVSAIAAGYDHTCALTGSGGVKCWGGAYGTIPMDVSGLTSGVSAIATGGEADEGRSHTCALTSTGGVKCWGYNYYGQLGDGTNASSPIPVDVYELDSGVSAITAGRQHTCARTQTGGVKCWGYNYYGQLGDGTTSSSNIPVDVSGLPSGASAIAAGYYYTCARTISSGVKCWGQNEDGQLGDGTQNDRYTPVDVIGLTSGVNAIAAGYEATCALTQAGGVKCWGRNSSGQLGDGTNDFQVIPVDVSGLTSEVSVIAAGYYHTCARNGSGGVMCWGANRSGQLGDGTYSWGQSTPVDVSGLSSGVSAIAAGGAHTCALTSTGGVKCWGNNGSGQLGDGTNTDRYTPDYVSGLASGVTAIAAGGGHTCALTSTGGVKCWGYNFDGRLGDGTWEYSRNTPVDVSGLSSGVTAIAAGGSHTCARTSTGGVKCWGGNMNGQLGDGTNTNRNTPVDVSGLDSGVSAIAAGWGHACALTDTGGVKCWGSNEYGQLGDGTYSWAQYTPVDVFGLSSEVSAIAAGVYHTCALTDSGGVKCWGSNYDGQLGDGTWDDRNTPVDVSGLASGVSAIAAGGSHTCALTNTGGVKCWGSNWDCQLGNGDTPHYLPHDVVGFEGQYNEIYLPLVKK